MKKINKLCWYAYKEDWNNREIKPTNIFDHCSLKEDIEKLNKKWKKDKSINLKEELRKDLQYYYWSKSEYEIILTSWPPMVEKQEFTRLNKAFEEANQKYRSDVNLSIETKIDIYDQIMLNYDIFFNYVSNIMGWGE